MRTIDDVSHAGRAAQLAIGLVALPMLHWALKTLAPVLSWLDEPSLVQTLAAAIAIIAAGMLLNITRGVGPGRRHHERRTRKHWDASLSTAAEAES